MILRPVLDEADRGRFEDQALVLHEGRIRRAIDAADASRRYAHQSVGSRFIGWGIGGATARKDGRQPQAEQQFRCMPAHAP